MKKYQSICRGMFSTCAPLHTAIGTVFIMMLMFGTPVFSQMSWKKATSPSFFSVRAAHGMLSFENKLYIFSGTSTIVSTNGFSSADGTNWTLLGDTVGFKLGCYYGYVVYNGYMWILGGGTFGEG